MEDGDFNVHDINVAEQQVISNKGDVVQTKRVTFMVGTHGPFTRVYNPASAGTAAAIRADITAQVDELKQIHQL